MNSDDVLVSDLKSDGLVKDQAFAHLRTKLIRTMGVKLKSMYDVDDSFVEDITQEALIIILKKLDTFRGESAFFTWACAIAVRLAMAEVRRKRWTDYSFEDLSTEGVFEFPAGSGDFTEQIAAKETLNTVKMSIMTALTEKQRNALLAELDGLTTDEIARRYGTSRGAIYKLTHDARRALIKDLHKKGFNLEAALEQTS